ncbi:DUF262 domain-containing protein [Lentzea sp. DG1S-22]|uniref:DUF262 domain-containing protein n=1 Tax=Lentzea sp. DG1S-22 TaxID=3108822 RepID=UPI002E7764CA|nr:DUF262 domain-containing protein [Lentzea sp. DG1S-22]WVH79222.1 DUF262 domain-containing protein [Lentzea sp. DG1S-22]
MDQVDEQVEDSEDDQDTVIQDLEPLSYFGTDFDVHGLVRRLNSGDIVVPNFDPAPTGTPGTGGFQRKFVWKRPQMDRFVESLLLGFPIPGIFLVQQRNKKLLVLDGQQRLRTLQRFYDEKLENGAQFVLDNVADDFKGLKYSELEEDLRRTLDNTFIHATVVKYSPTVSGNESVYSLFERLNTGGTNLYPQEIRVALYHGSLVEAIRDMNAFPAWRNIFGPPSERLKDQELILRFLAFWKEESQYKRPLKGFLNEFLGRHKNMEGLNIEELRRTFEDTCNTASELLGRPALRAESQVNAAFADAMMIGIATRLKSGPITDGEALKAAREKLLENPEFKSSIARATADEDRVTRRLSMAKKAFRAVP